MYAQSTVRRFTRWLSNPRIEVHRLYGPLIQQALAEWGRRRLYLALDTSLLWGKYCLIRISVIYRGRAVPLVWKVLAHSSSSVAFEAYKDLPACAGRLHKAAELLPPGCQVVFLADRGFADIDLMTALKRLGWHYSACACTHADRRIRIKGSLWVYRHGHRRCQVNKIPLACGPAWAGTPADRQARFWHHLYITAQRFGPVHLALACLGGYARRQARPPSGLRGRR